MTIAQSMADSKNIATLPHGVGLRCDQCVTVIDYHNEWDTIIENMQQLKLSQEGIRH